MRRIETAESTAGEVVGMMRESGRGGLVLYKRCAVSTACVWPALGRQHGSTLSRTSPRHATVSAASV